MRLCVTMSVLDELDAVRERRPLAVYVDAPGGTGKTYTFNTLLAAVRSDGEVALAVAFSGIAATLLEGGRTFHSRFKAPLQLTATSTCNVPVQSPLADLIRRAQLIVWDEAPMAHRHLLEALDRTLRDVMGSDQPFGGKVLVLGGSSFARSSPWSGEFGNVISLNTLKYKCIYSLQMK